MNNAEEHRQTILTVVLCAKMLAEAGVREALQAIEHAEAVGPILDPTLYIRKGRAMSEDKELLQAAIPLVALGERLAAANAEEESRG